MLTIINSPVGPGRTDGRKPMLRPTDLLLVLKAPIRVSSDSYTKLFRDLFLAFFHDNLVIAGELVIEKTISI